MKGRKLFCAIVTLALLTLAPLYTQAQQPAPQGTVDLGAFTKEIMLMRLAGQQDLVMWLPYEFFVAAGSAPGSVSKESPRT